MEDVSDPEILPQGIRKVKGGCLLRIFVYSALFMRLTIDRHLNGLAKQEADSVGAIG